VETLSKYRENGQLLCLYPLAMSTSNIGQFPQLRLRRSRRTAAMRNLVAETGLGPTDLIYPVFVLDGQKRTQAVPSMPGIERKSVDVLLKELERVSELGIPAIALFPVIGADKKSLDGADDEVALEYGREAGMTRLEGRVKEVLREN